MKRFQETFKIGLFFLLLSCPAVLSAQEASFEWIGNTLSGAEGVSADGSVVVGWSLNLLMPCDTPLKFCGGAVRWVGPAGPAEFLGSLSGDPNDTIATVVSGDGNVVVGVASMIYYEDVADEYDDEFITEAAFVSISGATMGQLGSLGNGFVDDILSYKPYSRPFAASYDGSVIVGYGKINELPDSGIIWMGNETLRLIGSPRDVSADGRVVVGFLDFGKDMWTETDGYTDIPGVKRAFGISPDGKFVVGLGNALGGGVRWSADTGITQVGMVNPTDVSADGSVVVGWDVVGGEQQAAIWTEEDGARLLEALLTEDFGIDIGIARLQSVTGVSDDGRILVGTGFREDAERIQAYRAVLPSACNAWLDDDGGPFEDATKWIYNNVPTDADCIVFDLASQTEYTVDFSAFQDAGSIHVNTDAVRLDLNGFLLNVGALQANPDNEEPTLTIASDPDESAVLSVIDGALLVTNGVAVIGDQASSGILDIGSGGQVVLPTSDQWLEMAGADSSSASVNIHDGGFLRTPAAFSSITRSTLTAVVIEGAGSKWEAGSVSFGHKGFAGLVISDSGEAEFTSLVLGAADTAATGIISVEGMDSILNFTEEGFFTIGELGTGEVRVDLEATVSQPTITQLGVGLNSSGKIHLKGVSKWFGGPLFVGGNGLGEVLIEEASQVFLDNLEIGLYEGPGDDIPANEVTITGEGSLLILTNSGVPSLVGRGGPAILQIRENARFEAKGDLYIGGEPVDPGQTAEKSGSLLSGSGSKTKIDIGGVLAVGDQSQGFVTLSDGATVTANELWVGVDQSPANDTSLVWLSGAGTELLSNAILVGVGAPGLLQIFAPAATKTNYLEIGEYGQLIGEVLTLGPTGIPSKNSGFNDAVGVYADTLILRQGAVLNVDSVLFVGNAFLGGSVWPFDLTNLGTIAPGDSSGTVGTYTVAGDYVQDSNGVLEIELSADTHDALDVDGSATLGGTLRLTYLGGFIPRVGDRFEIVKAADLDGEFDAIEKPADDLIFDLIYEATTVIVNVISSVAIENTLSADIPRTFQLYQNYPNPFNPSTQIRYEVAQSGPVRILVYDALGREVVTVADGMHAPGRYEVLYEAADLPSGLYLYRMTAKGFARTHTMLLVR